jgi:hypothetical protein
MPEVINAEKWLKTPNRQGKWLCLTVGFQNYDPQTIRDYDVNNERDGARVIKADFIHVHWAYDQKTKSKILLQTYAPFTSRYPSMPLPEDTDAVKYFYIGPFELPFDQR